MNNDIRKAVEVINQRIENLERIKSLLLEEFGSSSVLGAVKTAADKPMKRLGAGASHNGHDNDSGSEISRKEQLIKFLTEHGPSTRGTINEKSGIPKGTVAYLLTKPGFVRRLGKWSVGTSSAPQETTQ